MTLSRPIHILLVDDNQGDVLLTQEAFRTAKVANTMDIAVDGEQALAMLRKQDDYASLNTPDLILLDLNMPKKDGREVLAEIKSDANLKSIPVAIMTSSKAEADIVKTYQLHANCYILKPVTLDQFVDVVSSIEHFWFSVVVLPTDVLE